MTYGALQSGPRNTYGALQEAAPGCQLAPSARPWLPDDLSQLQGQVEGSFADAAARCAAALWLKVLSCNRPPFPLATPPPPPPQPLSLRVRAPPGVSHAGQVLASLAEPATCRSVFLSPLHFSS